ncbi:MAG TPA: cyanophycinase [Thermomicrobiales bacterium]|jgi:cyanophycinase|nr:cyanophycinase [Thermomicrobiales bacterium]
MSESGKATQSSDEQSDPVSSAPVRQVRQGPVLPIGGAEKKGTDEETAVLERFFDLAGGKRARIIVIPTASEEPQEAAERYIRVFGELGARSVEVLDVKERSDANGDAAVEQIRNASGIFITGGAQARLVSLLVGTRVMEEIRARNADGVVVAGTSAGASIVASHMMVGGTGNGGNSSDAAARKAMVELVAGFGLLQDVIIDQHFSQRGRMGRLISVFAANPGLLGIGLDEDTAVEIDREGHLVVHGSGMVTVVDGRSTTSNYFDVEPGEVLTVTGSSLHVMGAGQTFDLNERRVVGLPTT